MSFFAQSNTKTDLEVLQAKIPKIFISTNALIKMELFTENCTDEIGWLGTAYKKDNNYYIEDVMLFEQDVSTTTTEITPEGLLTFGEQLLEEKNGIEIWNNIKVWGHSHIKMSVTPSTQDDNQMEVFGDNNSDWFIRIITNQKGDIKIDLYDYEIGIIYTNIKWFKLLSDEEKEIENQIIQLYQKLNKIQDEKIEEYKEYVLQEIKDKVSKKTYVYNNTNNKWDDWRTQHVPVVRRTTNLITITDVYEFFTPEQLYEISLCKTDDELKELLRVYYYNNLFTPNEIKIIKQAAEDFDETALYSYYNHLNY